jgi:CDP-glucose 4,6-dehydratase
MNVEFWRGRKVFLTGHTGFKGSWLSLWLSEMGAEVHGFALAPSTNPSLFEVAHIEEALASHTIGDIRSLAAVETALSASQADIVLHLAAQPLVLESYSDPLTTFETNVMGGANLLDACRRVPSVKAIVFVTSDKCYENRETIWAYRETDAMGGYDPYSSSKGCSELIAASMAKSYFSGPNAAVVATGRAGNVIGGGDWSKDRLTVDILNGLAKGEMVTIRRPDAVRPWQHVLEPLSGYLTLAERIRTSKPAGFEGWNFGPYVESERTVGDLARIMVQKWGSPNLLNIDPPREILHEANLLKLDITKAMTSLGWRPRLNFDQTLEWTIAWRRAFEDKKNMRDTTVQQIKTYMSLLES